MLAEAVNLLRQETGACDVVGVSANIADATSVDTAFDTAKGEFGQLDCLVNNAGIIRMGPAVESTAESWNEQFNKSSLNNGPMGSGAGSAWRH